MPHPLEQGLRQSRDHGYPPISVVRVPHPLEQGLRLQEVRLQCDILQQRQSAPSIRTRIKT